VVLCWAAITPLVKAKTANRQTRTNNAFFMPFRSLLYEFFSGKTDARTGMAPERRVAAAS
jgi:hypothetical protein